MQKMEKRPHWLKFTPLPDWSWTTHGLIILMTMAWGVGLGACLWDFKGASLAGWLLLLAIVYLLIVIIRFVAWWTYPLRRSLRKKKRPRGNGIVSGYIAVLALFALFIGIPVGAQWLAAALGIARVWGGILGILLAVPAQLLLHAVLYFVQWLFIIRKQP